MYKNGAAGDRTDRLDALGKLLHRRVAPHVEHIVSLGHSSHPLVVDIDPSSCCNMSCPHCVDRISRAGTYLPTERLTGLAGELSHMGVGAAVVVGGGEPLTHPDIDVFLAALAGNGVRVGLVTNGLNLGQHLEAVAKHCSWVRVSLDAATPRTFAAVHGVKAGAFWQIVDAIRILAGTGTTVGMSFVIMNKNRMELGAAYQLALELGCAYVEFKPLISPYTKGIVPMENGARRHLAALIDGMGTGGIAGPEVLLTDSLRVALGGRAQQVKDYVSCYACEVRTVITPSGVFPCSYHRGDSRFLLGDICRESLADIWEGRRRRQAPSPAYDCDFYCARHGINEAIFALAASGKAGDEIAACVREIRETPDEDSYFI